MFWRTLNERNPNRVALRLALHRRRLTQVLSAAAVPAPQHRRFFLFPVSRTQKLGRFSSALHLRWLLGTDPEAQPRKKPETSKLLVMDHHLASDSPQVRPRWRKVAYGGMQPGFDDNHTDESFLEGMVMNANVVRRDMLKVMLDSVSISEYLCIVALVVLVWTYTLESTIDESRLLCIDVSLLVLGFLILLFTQEKISLSILVHHYFLNISFFIMGLYVLAPIYQTLTRSISSDSIWALTVSLLVIHLFLHDYSESTVNAPGALKNPALTSCISVNASVVASVFIASRLPSRLHVFAIMLFSLQVFLFGPLVTYCIKKYSFRLHLCFSISLMVVTLRFVYMLHCLLFVLLLSLLVFVNVVCPYWLIRIQEYKFEINGPWDEAKLCFAITD
ncbi:hypothetical protein Ahy_A03g016160 isoform B [Arachis hypogaea]|uniref:Phosphatidylinositol N-acetylglucosaminyltransferase subunit C n=1 Tax=Arachis hypogaea TaxID=3818 RepID=A0A445E2F8_ARAHY|nr:hypothetical protein Ahy_A03g016160 isoform B [Arachis hypogaea]